MVETSFETARLVLRSWREDDLTDFTRLLGNPEAMRDYPHPFGARTCEKRLADYMLAHQNHGYVRWRVATKAGDFLGYVGPYPNGTDHPLGAHGDIGWRLLPHAWGYGYATEAAGAALDHAFEKVGLSEVLAYTQADNLSSQAVISRLPFHRDPSRDFSIEDDHHGIWHGLVWVMWR
ncbi:GNAT family N-acetyltransferase [Roseovarius aestuarii]|uniref:N-acetyltransferase domain-containing protein n=1 Tax=Roseovarius aestuarii TaxID=475083 RepID=A0A1X7BNH8_9RHOB|nr:GNAT family N-acetyltransferase [Roseovarius aestuarii]SMC11175.1 hypothetical protein ROA7745_00986 [Roseovarius aestuarii]